MTELEAGPGWRAWLTTMRRGPRGIWSNGERVHVEVLAIDRFARARYAKRLCEEVEALEGVRWARLNTPLGRLIVALEPRGADEAALVDRIEAVERELGAGPGFATPCPPYPADHAPIRRNAVEIAAAAIGLVASTTRQLAGEAHSRYDIDLAALVSLVDGIPQVKTSLARHASRNLADLGIELTKSVSQTSVEGSSSALFAGRRGSSGLTTGNDSPVRAGGRGGGAARRPLSACGRVRGATIVAPGDPHTCLQLFSRCSTTSRCCSTTSR
jgi:hypothetical protein